MDAVPDATRIERERAFHDDRYSDEVRTRVGKYYAVDAGKARYRDLLAAIPADGRVLEYGCGKGSEAFDLAERGANVEGIDISPVAVIEAKAEAVRRGLSDRLRFTEMNAEALDFGGASFDAVCGSGILHHLDVDRALREVARVLVRDGQAVFVEPLGTNPLINMYRRVTPRLRTADEHPLGPLDVETAALYFADVEAEHFNFLALAGVAVRRMPGGARVVRALHQADAWLFRKLPVTRRLAWVIVLRLARPRDTVPGD